MEDMHRHGKRTVRDWNILISLVKSHPQREAWGLGGLPAFLISLFDAAKLLGREFSNISKQRA